MKGRLTTHHPWGTLTVLSQGESVPVNLQPFPARDDAFARDVSAAAEAAASESAGEGELVAIIQARLRAIYPNAVVRMQEPFGRLNDGVNTLYAYRDGAIVAEDAS
jgi:hypothetical protein